MSALKFVFSAVILVLNTLLFCASMTPFALIKLLLPFAPVRRATDRVLNFIPQLWISVNNFWLMAVNRSQWQVRGLEGLRPDGWYLVTSNHLSWVDILVLQRVLNRRIPMLKFFLKYELIYVPVLGLAWWALDFPFMRRGGGANARKDLKAAREACEKFRLLPTSVMSFAEGTRFTAAKHADQQSPYQHLLQPKSGGLGMALSTIGELFTGLISAQPIELDGSPALVVAVRDITELKQTQQRLQVSEEKFAKAFHASPDGLLITRLSDGRLLEANEGFCRITGYELSQVVGRTTNEIGLWANLHDRDRLIEQVRSQGMVDRKSVV